MRIALVSLDQHWLDKDANFERCTSFVKSAAERGCSLVVFPEMTLTGYSFDLDASIEEREDSETLTRFGALAKESGVTVVFGAGLSEVGAERAFNSLCLAKPDGSCAPVYSKIHLFTFAGEDSFLEAGRSPATFSVEGGGFLASICYDLRFPEIYSAYADKTQAAFVIANWPARRVAHWRALLVARAIENQSYMIGVNCVGVDGNDLTYEKSSMLVSPEGVVLSPVIAGEEMDIYEMDLEEVQKYRSSFPTVKDKRFDLYQEVLR